MNMRKRTWFVPAFTAMALAGLVFASAPADAAVITYVGNQDNVDAKQTTLPGSPDASGWRNSTPVKPLDIDGDNILGTDGWYHRGDGPAPGTGLGTQLPSYIGSVSRLSTGGNNFGYADNPFDPTGIDNFRTGYWGNNDSNVLDLDLMEFTIGGSGLDEETTLRVAIQYDSSNTTGTFTYRLRQTVGGSATAISPTLVLGNDGYDWAFFDLVGTSVGDEFTLSSADIGAVNTIGRHQWGGMAFDTFTPQPVPEPTTISLTVLGLLGLIRKSRRRV